MHPSTAELNVILADKGAVCIFIVPCELGTCLYHFTTQCCPSWSYSVRRRDSEWSFVNKCSHAAYCRRAAQAVYVHDINNIQIQVTYFSQTGCCIGPQQARWPDRAILICGGCTLGKCHRQMMCAWLSAGLICISTGMWNENMQNDHKKDEMSTQRSETTKIRYKMS